VSVPILNLKGVVVKSEPLAVFSLSSPRSCWQLRVDPCHRLTPKSCNCYCTLKAILRAQQLREIWSEALWPFNTYLWNVASRGYNGALNQIWCS